MPLHQPRPGGYVWLSSYRSRGDQARAASGEAVAYSGQEFEKTITISLLSAHDAIEVTGQGDAGLSRQQDPGLRKRCHDSQSRRRCMGLESPHDALDWMPRQDWAGLQGEGYGSFAWECRLAWSSSSSSTPAAANEKNTKPLPPRHKDGR